MSDNAGAIALTDALRQRADAAIEAGKVLLPSARRETEERARQVEQERRASGPLPRQLLREAHGRRLAAKEEADRLEGALERARQHLAEVEMHRDELAEEIEAAEVASTAALIAELSDVAAGRPSPTSQIAGDRRVALANAEAERAIARRAVELLGAELDAAQRRVSAASRDTMAAAVAVLLAVAER